MTEYDNSNRGALFKNDRKEKETHPDYKGSVNAAGVDYWLSAWLNESRDGKKYMSLSLQPKEQQNNERPQTLAEKSNGKPPAADDEPFSDDIPF